MRKFEHNKSKSLNTSNDSIFSSAPRKKFGVVTDQTSSKSTGLTLNSGKHKRQIAKAHTEFIENKKEN